MLEKMRKRAMAILLIVTLAVMTTACASKTPKEPNETPEATVAPTEVAEEAPTPTEEPVRDLGGMEIVIGNWWGDWSVETAEPKSAADEATLDWRTKIQEKYNFKMREANIGGWGEYQEIATTSIVSGTPAASMFIVGPGWFMAFQSQGLFYPISDLPSVDFTNPVPLAWNQEQINAATFGGKAYGFSVGYGEGEGIFFNKRLLEEAGISPDAPYDMQKDGTWTWDNFLEMCKKVTRDVDNDGNIDIYALATTAGDIQNGAVWSNKAKYVDKDAAGKFVNTSNTPEFLQALQFTMRLSNEKVLMTQPEGSEWDWYTKAFYEGKSVFWPSATWQIGNINNNLADDWGFVMFPKGPNSTDYFNATADAFLCIPSTFSAEEADNIMFAYQLWSKPVEGYDDPDAWKTGAYQYYNDARAVDETLAMMHGGKNSVVAYHNFITGFNVWDIATSIWGEGADPAQLIEAAEPNWNTLIDDINKMLD